MSINYVQKYVQQRYHKEDNVLKQFPTTVKRRWEILWKIISFHLIGLKSLFNFQF